MMKKLLIVLTILIGLVPMTANAQNEVEIECGQKHILLEREDGYKIYEADATWADTWRGLELTSMVAKYWNGIMTINSKVGWSDSKYTMNSPMTCTQLESKNFGVALSIPVEEPEETPQVVELKEENKELKQDLMKAMSLIEDLYTKYNLTK